VREQLEKVEEEGVDVLPMIEDGVSLQVDDDGGDSRHWDEERSELQLQLFLHQFCIHSHHLCVLQTFSHIDTCHLL